LKINPQMIAPMRDWEALTDASRTPAGPITAAFFRGGAPTYRAAARLVYRLPYGRTSSRDNPMAVLTEGRGTCSSKHALLAELAIEQCLPLALMLGIYLMNERNTPGVGGVLARYGLADIPEAHCYLMDEGVRIDITRDITSGTEAIAALLYEQQIAPPQVGLYKVRVHQEFLRNWLQAVDFGKSWTFDQLWPVREECIAALAAPASSRTLGTR
jgi:hypothetical protein